MPPRSQHMEETDEVPWDLVQGNFQADVHGHPHPQGVRGDGFRQPGPDDHAGGGRPGFRGDGHGPADLSHGDRFHRGFRERGPEEEVPPGDGQGREAGDDRGDRGHRGVRSHGHSDHGQTPGRQLCPEREEVLHHPRPRGGHDHDHGQDRRRAEGFQRLHRGEVIPRVQARQEREKIRAPRLQHRGDRPGKLRGPQGKPAGQRRGRAQSIHDHDQRSGAGRHGRVRPGGDQAPAWKLPSNSPIKGSWAGSPSASTRASSG